MEGKIEILEKELRSLAKKIRQLITIQKASQNQSQRIQSIEFLDWLSIEQACIYTQLKSEDNLKRLMAATGVETRSVQGMSQGKGLKLRYNKEDIKNKIIVRYQDYEKMDLKKITS